jgi:transglutaminase superfamily protein
MAARVNNSLPEAAAIGYQPLAMASSTLRRLARLGWADRALLAEALVTLAFASLAIRLAPFRRVVRAASAFDRPPVPATAGDPPLERIIWAVLAVARRVPWKAVCFQRGLAAHVMLRRRGIGSFLHYGVAQGEPAGLQAHVWVSAAGRTILGGDEAPAFTCLATYPALSD